MQGKEPHMIHEINAGGLSVQISERGAELMSVRLHGHEYLWQADPQYWPDRSPLLFPFVGRFTEGKYTVHQKEYHLPIHGFAKDSVFETAELSGNSITLRLRDSEESRKVYPFRFTLLVTYALGEQSLTTAYEVRSEDSGIMYFGIGGHPGLQVPMEEGLRFDDYVLEFGEKCLPARVGHTEACFLSGEDVSWPLENGTGLPLRHDLFDEDAIVLKNAADSVTLRSEKGSRAVTMRWRNLPYLGLWHAPRTEAPYLCIEPWTSLPSRQDIVEEFSCKSDLIRLEPGETFRAGWDMILK